MELESLNEAGISAPAGTRAFLSMNLGYIFQLQSRKCNLFWVIAEAEGTQGYLKAWGYIVFKKKKKKVIATEGILRFIWLAEQWQMGECSVKLFENQFGNVSYV